MRARERDRESRHDTFSLKSTCSSVHVHYYEASTLPGQSGSESYLHLSSPATERLTVGWQNSLASVLENQDFQNHVFLTSYTGLPLLNAQMQTQPQTWQWIFVLFGLYIFEFLTFHVHDARSPRMRCSKLAVKAHEPDLSFI